MFKGASIILDLQLRDLPETSEECKNLKELLLQLNPGNEEWTDYREKFLEFIKSLEIRNPEEFIEEPTDRINAFALLLKGFLSPFPNRDDLFSKLEE
jgi:hypothetical protein